ncbi:hypothetical protein [Streptomyces sp. NPDC052042]|uniref:hypothetical protein n=1 Tax=Streptomyces sp. NPDC052042 TaxID=3365683 RepID=UPI0037D8A808
MPALPSPDEVEAARTQRDQLAAWGVSWPPPKGWKEQLADRWRAARQDVAPPPQPSPAFAQETLDFG